jgi:hypothetical protein
MSVWTFAVESQLELPGSFYVNWLGSIPRLTSALPRSICSNVLLLPYTIICPMPVILPALAVHDHVDRKVFNGMEIGAIVTTNVFNPHMPSQLSLWSITDELAIASSMAVDTPIVEEHRFRFQLVFKTIFRGTICTIRAILKAILVYVMVLLMELTVSVAYTSQH